MSVTVGRSFIYPFP